MDFYIDLAFTVLLRFLKTAKPNNPYRKALLKLFKAIATLYVSDQEFTEVAASVAK